MLKKVLFSMLAAAMVLPIFSTSPVLAAGQVCGMDGHNYASTEAAEAAGIDVSYEFACVNPISEEGLYEAMSEVNFAGMLIEVGSTDIPTNLIIRDNATGHDYTVEVTSDTVLGQRRDQLTNLSDWIPGDQIKVIGKKNENNENVEAAILINLSIAVRINLGANGWITNIDKEAKEIRYQWMNKEYTFKYDDNTRFVAGLKNPATVDDLKINDRIRARLLLRSGEAPLAKIVVVLRRGPALFMKIRTFTPIATLVRLDSTIVPTTIQVKIEKTPGLRANDVNNLIGTEGALVTVNITENTKIVRKYFGRTTLEEFSIGDKLRIVGRVNDDGTIDAKVVKNNSIWKTSVKGYAGVVTRVNANDNYIMVNWTPIKYLTRKKLKEKLTEKDNEVTAQIINRETIRKNVIEKYVLTNRLKQRVKKIADKKVGKFLRKVKYKKVKIQRIKHDNIKINDLIERWPMEKIRVDINDKTRIVAGTNSNATISDIQVGDKVRIRGTKHANLPIVVADTIVVVSSLPEIEDDLDTLLNDVNEIVSEITTDDTDGAIVEDTTSDTEEEITDEEATDDGSAFTKESDESTTENNTTSESTAEEEVDSNTEEESAASTAQSA